MTQKQSKNQLFLLLVSSCGILLMLMQAYGMYKLSGNVANEIDSGSVGHQLKLELFTKLFISFLLISSISLVISNINKLRALLIAVFPLVAYLGCGYLISGSITAFGFPWLLTLPVLYIIGLFIFELLSGNKLIPKPIFKWSEVYTTKIVYTILALFLFVYLLSESQLIYKANVMFSVKDSIKYNLFNLISVNYLISGISLICIFIDKRIGLSLSFFPIILQVCYDIQLNGGQHILTSMHWEYFLAPLFIFILFIIKRIDIVKKVNE